MKSNLAQDAIQGTYGKTIDFASPTLARFSNVFSDASVSTEKKLGLALGIEATVELSTCRRAEGDVTNSFAFEGLDYSVFVPREVAEATATILNAYGGAALRFPTVQPTLKDVDRPELAARRKIYPGASLIRTLARYDLTIPPECCSILMRSLEGREYALSNARHIASITPPNARELAVSEVVFSRALERAFLYLGANDVPQGVTFGEIEARVLNGALDAEAVLAAAALRRLAPDRARRAIESALDRLPEEDLERGVELLACMRIGLDAADAPFLKSVFNMKRSPLLAFNAGELLARLREPELLDKLVKFADDRLTRDGVFTPLAPSRNQWNLVCAAKSDAERPNVFVENLFKRVPLEHWEEYFGAEPEAILDMLAKNELFASILAGLRGSLLLFDGPQRWTAPLARRSAVWASNDDFAIWLDEALSATDPRDVTAVREIVDVVRSTATDVRAINQAQVATQLALYEPYPWRDEFAEYFDSALWSALSLHDAASRVQGNLRRKSTKRVSAADDGRKRAKDFFKATGKLRKTIGSNVRRKKKLVVSVVKNDSSKAANNVDEVKTFIYLFAANVMPILYLAPKELRKKYLEYGEKLYNRFLRVVYEAFSRASDNVRGCIFKLCDMDAPFFPYMKLFESLEFERAAETLETFLLSRGREESSFSGESRRV